jgi:two-component system sensor histidine kinase ArlS
MPVRLRITLLFAGLVFIIMGIVCSSIYYFAFKHRLNSIKTRLTNRAITTGRLFSQREIFDQKLIQRIDSLTRLSLKEKVVKVYNDQNYLIYSYADAFTDSLNTDAHILDEARLKQTVYFRKGDKEAIAYYYSDDNNHMVIVSAAKDEDGKKNLNQLKTILILNFFVGVIITFLTGYFFSRQLLLPIKKITTDISEISAQNLVRRISKGRTHDEWYDLTSKLNELLTRLQESFELQRRFISNASHELSTPLTSISSQLEISLQKERSAEDYRKVMQSIYQDVLHMIKLTQTLLEFAKASGNPGGLDISLVRIDEIILQLPAELAKFDNSYSVLLEYGHLPENEEKLLVFGNETLLLTAIKNIVLNACKYSENQQATIRLEVSDKNIIISISDKGPGIPQKEIENIFQPFYRIEDNRTMGGFGLGLSLAQRIIKLHKGEVSVHSEEKAGSLFTILFPSASGIDAL